MPLLVVSLVDCKKVEERSFFNEKNKETNFVNQSTPFQLFLTSPRLLLKSKDQSKHPKGSIVYKEAIDVLSCLIRGLHERRRLFDSLLAGDVVILSDKTWFCKYWFFLVAGNGKLINRLSIVRFINGARSKRTIYKWYELINGGQQSNFLRLLSPCASLRAYCI